MDKRTIGVYICSGCSIADAVDVSALAKVAQSECKAAVCRAHPLLCSAEGLREIRSDLETRGVNAVVVAGCSPRARAEEFTFDDWVVVERVNLREQVAWCQEPKHEDTQMLAADNLRMGIARVARIEAPDHQTEPLAQSILVVGGGITGLSAALHAAEAGRDVILVEKEAELGGAARTSVHRKDGVLATEIGKRIDELRAHPRIDVHCSTRVASISGQPGRFEVTLSNGAESRHQAGAVIMATGWKPYDPSKLAKLGYGLPDVLTSAEFDQLAASGAITCKATGKEPKSILFVQCAGSRSPEHLPYCSAACCTNTLRQITTIRDRLPGAEVFVVYRDMVTPGLHERVYRTVQDDERNFFLKGTVEGVARATGQLTVRISESPLAEQVEIPVDMVVLATGMVPNSADNDAIRTWRDARRAIERNESETQRQEAEKTAAQLQHHAATEILNLAYRQGPDLPVRRYGFPDSHFICFPFETQRTGIYAAGAVRAPMDAAMAEEDAAGAVMKAIQSISLAARGEAVHPRAGDASFPEFALQRCTQCKRCTVECPFGTLDEDEKGTPKFNSYRCRRCGICMGACPERIVSFKNYSVDSIAAMVKAIEVPDEFSEKPRVLVFACENDAYPALDMAGVQRARYDPSVRVIPLRCLGSLNIVWIADALSLGIDGILLLGCKFGDDYQCHFIRGSELANRRLENVKDTFQKLQLEPERIQLVQLAIDDHVRVPTIINEFVDKMRALGPNPYKGF